MVLSEVDLGEVSSHEEGLGEVTSALEMAGGESESILASDEDFTRGCGCQMNDNGRCLERLDGRRLQREVSEPGQQRRRTRGKCVWVKQGYMEISPLSMRLRPAHRGSACGGVV